MASELGPEIQAGTRGDLRECGSAARRRTRQEDGDLRPSHIDFSESGDRGQSRHHDPNLFLQDSGGDAGAELDTRAEGRIAGNPQASSLQLHGLSGPGRLWYA